MSRPKSLRCLSFIGALLVCGFASADTPPEPLTIATWNLEWFFDDNLRDNYSDVAKEQSSTSQEEWLWKLNTTASAIAKFKPTILLAQEIEGREVMYALATTLKDRHNLSYRVAFIDGNDRSTEQDVAILYQSGLVEFSRREQNNEMFRSREFYNLSKHVIGRFEWQVADRTESLTVLNVHLRATAEASEPRIKQCKLAHEWMRRQIERGENVIIAGDLNVEDLAGDVKADGDGMHWVLGRGTATSKDDLVDLLEKAPIDKRRTHLILERQFDRILASPAMMKTEGTGILFQKIEVLSEHNIRGQGADLDHWDTRYTKPHQERDISDHHPVMATFLIR
ncbi:MAG: endonuclease/exonuclease/phosphatase family protein [Pirellula sp.]|nr:endonuclease/exonuclease/phosphatase family protein [Pirellula sp.]